MFLPALTCVILAAIVLWQRQRIRQLTGTNKYLRTRLRKYEYLIWVKRGVA